MRTGYTHISALLDASGSMGTIIEDMKGGFKNYIDEQKKLDGQLTLSLSAFSDQYKYNVIYDFLQVSKDTTINLREYVADGWTALLRSACVLIDQTGKKLANLSEDERPEKVIFVIITDGGENDSNGEMSGKRSWFTGSTTTFGSQLFKEKVYTNDLLNEKISHQKDKYNWQFVFLGANQDSFAVGRSYGITRDATMNFAADSAGVNNLYTSLSASTASYRKGVSKSFSLHDTSVEEVENK